MTRSLPLDGRRILITRSQAQARSMVQKVEDLGGIPIVTPVLSFQGIALTDQEKRLILEQDWLLFTSANGVKHFFEQVALNGLGHVPRLAVVGRKTADSLAQFGLKPDLIPASFTAHDLAEAFSSISGRQSIALIKGQLARDTLEASLQKQNHFVQSYTVYQTVPNYKEQSHLQQVLERHTIDALTLTSPSSLSFFLELTGFVPKDPFFHKTVIGCIGPETRRFAHEMGLKRLVMPTHYTVQALIDALGHYYLEGFTCQP